MGVEYGGKSCRATGLFVVFDKGLQDIPDTGEHQGIDDFLIFTGKAPDLLRNREGDQVVLGRQTLAQLIFDPLSVLVVPAKQCRFENTHLYCFVNT